MIPTILLSASTYELVGTALAGAQIALTLTRSDVVPGPGGGIVAAGRTVIACDSSGLGSAEVFPNAAGTQGTGYLVEVFDSTGALRLTSRTSLPNQDCNLHEVLFTIPPMSQSDADAAVIAARAQGAAGAADVVGSFQSAVVQMATNLVATQTIIARYHAFT